MAKTLINFTRLFSIIVTIHIFFLLSNLSIIGYQNLFLLPLAYIFITFTANILTSKMSLTYISFMLLSLVRLVIIPYLSVLSHQFTSLTTYVPNSININSSIFLIVYESIVCAFFLVFFIIKEKEFNRLTYVQKKENNRELLGNKLFYLLIGVFSFFIYSFFGKNLVKINFFIIKSSGIGERLGDNEGLIANIITQIFLSGLIFSFLLLTSFLKKRFNSEVAYRGSIVAAILNLGFIIGERRSLQIYTAYATLNVLINQFKSKKRKTYVYVVIGLSSLLIIMSLYKFLNVFLYNNYAEAIKNSDFDFSESVRMLNIYFGGVDLTAIPIEMSQNLNIKLGNMFYDLFRSVFGLSFMFKNVGVLTTEIFNSYVYGTFRSSGQLMSSLGYGYLYLGPVLSPLFTILNIRITLFLEKRMLCTKSLEMLYIYSYIFARFFTNIFQVTPPLINMGTTFLFTIGSVYLVSKLINSKKKKVVI